MKRGYPPIVRSSSIPTPAWVGPLAGPAMQHSECESDETSARRRLCPCAGTCPHGGVRMAGAAAQRAARTFPGDHHGSGNVHAHPERSRRSGEIAARNALRLLRVCAVLLHAHDLPPRMGRCRSLPVRDSDRARWTDRDDCPRGAPQDRVTLRTASKVLRACAKLTTAPLGSGGTAAVSVGAISQLAFSGNTGDE
jgi:hypothetical protein